MYEHSWVQQLTLLPAAAMHWKSQSRKTPGSHGGPRQAAGTAVSSSPWTLCHSQCLSYPSWLGVSLHFNVISCAITQPRASTLRFIPVTANKNKHCDGNEVNSITLNLRHTETGSSSRPVNIRFSFSAGLNRHQAPGASQSGQSVGFLSTVTLC